MCVDRETTNVHHYKLNIKKEKNEIGIQHINLSGTHTLIKHSNALLSNHISIKCSRPGISM